MFLLHTVVLSKTRKLQYTNRVNLSVFTVHLAETHLYRHLPFSSNKLKQTCFLKLGITMLLHKKDDIEFVTEFPCLLGHPVLALFDILNLEYLI